MLENVIQSNYSQDLPDRKNFPSGVWLVKGLTY